MEPKNENERTPSEETRPADQPQVPRKRFRLEKLEERVAPKKKHGNSSGDVVYIGVSSY